MVILLELFNLALSVGVRRRRRCLEETETFSGGGWASQKEKRK